MRSLLRGVVEWRRGHRRGLPRGASCGEWSDVRCHDLSEHDGAAWDPLQDVEQSRGHHCGLPGSLGLSVEARLGYLVERGSSPSKRSSDVAGEPSTVGCLGR